MRIYSPFVQVQTREFYPVGAQDVAFFNNSLNPLYQDSFHVMGQLYTRAPNTAYTNQGRSAVSIDPMSQGFAGDLALQNLLQMTSNSNG
jgi:hypothetical protein